MDPNLGLLELDEEEVVGVNLFLVLSDELEVYLLLLDWK